MIAIAILSILSLWVSLGIIGKITGKEVSLDIAERIATALEWIAGWLNRVAAFDRAGIQMYRTLLQRDREIRGEYAEEEAS
jgi:hypothetical protein